MAIKQISVFLENKPGKLKEMTGVLAANNVDMRALSLAETKDFGIARLVVDDVFNAVNILKEANFVASLTSVLAVAVPDEPGGLDKGKRKNDPCADKAARHHNLRVLVRLGWPQILELHRRAGNPGHRARAIPRGPHPGSDQRRGLRPGPWHHRRGDPYGLHPRKHDRPRLAGGGDGGKGRGGGFEAARAEPAV